jgi:hypothetical protein
MPEAAQAIDGTQRVAERRRVPRVPFKATSVVAETGSSQVVVAQTTELSRFGCFVQTAKPYPKGTRVHLEISDGGEVFTAAAVVAYLTPEGMGVVFGMVEPDKYEILSKWLSRTPRRSDRHSFAATAQVRDLGSRTEQVVITRDLSAGGCFLKSATPLPKGSRIMVHIAHAGADFKAVGRVTDNISPEGMGIEFIEIEPTDRVVLQKWLRGETPINDAPTKLLVAGLFLLVGAAVIAAVALMIY